MVKTKLTVLKVPETPPGPTEEELGKKLKEVGERLNAMVVPKDDWVALKYEPGPGGDWPKDAEPKHVNVPAKEVLEKLDGPLYRHLRAILPDLDRNPYRQYGATPMDILAAYRVKKLAEGKYPTVVPQELIDALQLERYHGMKIMGMLIDNKADRPP